MTTTRKRSKSNPIRDRNRYAETVRAPRGDHAVVSATGATAALNATAAARPLDEAGRQDEIAHQLRHLACAVGSYATVELGAAIDGVRAGWCWGPLVSGGPSVLHRGCTDPDGEPIGTPTSRSVVELLAAALQATKAGGGLSALTVVVEACGLATPKPADLQRLDPILPRITVGAVNQAREHGERLLATDGRPGLRKSVLPLFPELADDDAIVPLLELADAATGDRAVAGGHGAAHELRLVFEALTALPPGGYAGGVAVAYTVEDLLRAFYRGGAASMYRSGDRPGDWAQIRAACQWIDRAALPWRVPSGNMQSWFLMRLRTLPGERPALSDPVVFEVALPPGIEHGPAVNRPVLREAGRVSSPAFRIGIAVPTLTWVPGVTRRPVTRRGKLMQGPGWLWIGDSSRYPVLSMRDRRRIAFGPDATPRDRSGPKVDRVWRKAADAASVVILDTEAIERSGKRGWRVVPAEAAAAIRTAREKGRNG